MTKNSQVHEDFKTEKIAPFFTSEFIESKPWSSMKAERHRNFAAQPLHATLLRNLSKVSLAISSCLRLRVLVSSMYATNNPVVVVLGRRLCVNLFSSVTMQHSLCVITIFSNHDG